MINSKRLFRSLLFCLGGIVLFGAVWSSYQRGFFVPWQNLGYPPIAYLSADKAVEIQATDGRLIQVRTSGGQTQQTAVAWQNDQQSFWWAGYWYPTDDEISGTTAVDFGCPFGLLAPPRPRWFAKVVDEVTFKNCRRNIGETQLRIILLEDGNVWVWAYEKNLEEDSNRFLGLWLILGGLAGLGVGWSGPPIQRLKVVLSAGVLIIGMLGISWLVMGYWWNPFSPCEAPIQLQSGTIKPPWVLPFGTQVIENRGSVYFSPANAQALPASNLKVKLIPQTNCLSLSCTQVYERTGQMIVDPDTFTLRLSFRFAVKPIGSWRLGAVCGCTEECGGEGSLDYETGPLREGVYQVWLGETRLGEIAVPLEQASLSLNSPLPPYPTPGSEYPPPEATPVFAYPEPGMESSTLATPYPEPAATIPTPTPILRLQPIWYSPVITAALPISPAESIVTGEWLSATRLQLATIGYASSGLFWVDLAAAASSVITALPEPSTSRAYSAASQYGVECGSSLQMVDVVNQTVIRQAELTLNMHASTNCSSYVSWAGDQVAAFAAASDGQWHTYLWRPDGSAPFKVGAAVTQAKAPVWSPDLQQLAFLSLPEDATAGLQLAIVDANGRLIETIPVVGSAAGVEVRWLSPQVVAINSGEAASEPVWRFYTIPGGELLLTWGAPGPGIVDDLYHQLPALSPDQRWFLWEAGGFDNGAMHLSYRLYDAQNRQEILLYDRPSHGLRLSGWSPDGETLYLLHLQTGPDATADPDVPYGLLSYHLDSGRYELLVEDAQAVTWDAAYQKGLVYVFVREGDSQGTLVAGIWDPARRQVLGAYSVKGEPTRYNSFLVQSMYRSYTPAAWSPDGQRVVFFTWDGDLILMNLDGQTQRLASQIGLGRSDFTRLLAWSPDGSRLFVSDRGKAWIAVVQEWTGSGWEAKP